MNKNNPATYLAQWLYRSLYNKCQGRTYLNMSLLTKGFHIAFGEHYFGIGIKDKCQIVPYGEPITSNVSKYGYDLRIKVHGSM